MKQLILSTGAAAIAIIGAAWSVRAGGDLVQFPASFAGGVHYATVNRGNIRQDLYTSQAAIDAAKAGKPFPSGTVITLVDTRDDKLFRYVVMEKRTGWGGEYPEGVRNGEWEFQAFNADRTVNRAENLTRCFSCHQGQSQNDYVYTRNRMRDGK